ncbi:hypothetical protein FQA39_LY05076 [Lamprigera yunnana]|nr:hypothetical protein FQA39_LY05076 [Lamprigera yunnana]
MQFKKKASALRQDQIKTGGVPTELKNLTDVEEKILQLLGSSFFMGTDIPERCGSAIQKQLMAGKQHQSSCASGLQLTAITSPGVSANNRSLRLTPTSSSNYSEVLELSTAASHNPLDNTRLIELSNQSSTIVSALSRLTPTKGNRSPTVSNLRECSTKNAYEQSRDEEPHAAQKGMSTEHFDMHNSTLDVLKTISKTLIDVLKIQ